MLDISIHNFISMCAESTIVSLSVVNVCTVAVREPILGKIIRHYSLSFAMVFHPVRVCEPSNRLLSKLDLVSDV